MNLPKMKFTSAPAGEWASIPFNEVFSPLKNNTFSRSLLNDNGKGVKNIHYGDILIRYGDICNVASDEIPCVNAGESVEKYDFLQDGDVVIADTAEDDTVGKAVEIQNVQDQTVVSGLHTMACRPKKTFFPGYLGYFMNSPAFHRQLYPYMQGIKVISVSRKNISNTTIHYPDLEEQKRIVELLSGIDARITEQEGIIADLEERKKGLMQRIFSQELRFKADDGSEFPEWETKTLGDFGHVSMCKRVFKEQTDENGEIPFFKIGTFGGIPDAFISRSLFEELKSKYSYPKKGNILLSAAGTIGRTVVYGGEDAYFQDSNIVWLNHNDSILDEFLYHFYNSVSWGNLEGGTVKRLYNSILLEKEIALPSIPEQRKIAALFDMLDEEIKNTKVILDDWKTLKTGLLQQMFA